MGEISLAEKGGVLSLPSKTPKICSKKL